MSTRKLGSVKIRPSLPQERLIAKLSSNKARTSEKFVPRPSLLDSFCPTMMTGEGRQNLLKVGCAIA